MNSVEIKQQHQHIKTTKMTERNIKGLNVDMNDEKELSDYMELSFQS